jgi:hypothetical protein
MQPTMTAQAAAQQADANARAAASVLPQAILAPFDSGQTPCDDPTDNGPKGRVTPYVSYEVRTQDHDQAFDLLLNWWTANDFAVLADLRPDKMYVWVENRADGFRMAAKANDLGKLYLISNAPCVWPNGVPEPEAGQ